MESVINEEH